MAARGLAKRKLFGAQDPYLSFLLQGHRKFTRVAVKGGIKPVWNQTIKYNRVNDGPSTDDTTLKVYCFHEKSGSAKGSLDGLIGSCEIDLKKTVFASRNGIYIEWFILTMDGKETGEVHIRLQLCEPSEEEDQGEEAPIRLDNKNRVVKSKADKKAEKEDSNNKNGKGASGSGAIDPSKAGSSSSASHQPNNDNVQRTSSNRLNRPRSLADLKEQKPTTKFQEPSQHRVGSRSLEEVRDMAATPGSSDGDSGTLDGEEAVGSPKPTFTSQDSQGNINQLNVLIAPFNPEWLQPTPQILKRALSAQLYYTDLQTQMASTPGELLPRPQQPSYGGYSANPVYMPNGQPQQTFQSFSQAQQPQPHAQAPNGNQRPNIMPTNANQYPQQQQHQQHQQQPNPPSQPGMYNSMPVAQPQMMSGPLSMPTPPQQNWGGQSPGMVNYRAQTTFQPRQQAPRSRMDQSENSKYMSLPSRNNFTPQQLQMLRNSGEGPNQFSPPQVNSTMMPNMPEQYPQQGMASMSPIPGGSSLGPAAGYIPNTYSQEHQRVLTNQLPQPAPPVNQPVSQLGLEPRVVAQRVQGSHPEIERPGTSQMHYPQQQSKVSSPGQNTYYSSPIPQQGSFPSPQQQQQQQQQLQQQRPLSITISRQGTSSFTGLESFNTMQKSPQMSAPFRVPSKAKDAIIAQYAPREVTWEGMDIQESVIDTSITSVGRRILSRYALGMTREKYVREGFYTNDRSPSSQPQPLQQQRTGPQRLQPQRQNTIEDGNNRVILKYLKAKREWEIDSVMMRYLTCIHPEERLESQYLDYAQPQQHCMTVNPFVVGLYETFMHPYGTDLDGCRYLSVLQWFPETLQGYIDDRIASGEGLEVTLPIIRSLIECVEWIHSRKVCHLNIKPSNFARDPYAASSMNRNNGMGWKLVDFEAARVISEEIVGRCTFSFAAPEILIGHSTSTGVLARGSLDIWSLGLVIYELLTDQPLFRTDDQAKDALLRPKANSSNNDNTSRGMIKPVRYYDSKSIGPEYHPLLDAMLAYDPEKRLTATQLLQMDIFTKPISLQPVSQDQMIRNNNVLSLRDVKATRLCNIQSGQTSDQAGGQRRGGGGGWDYNNSTDSGDSTYGSSSFSPQMMLLEGIGRVLDSTFDQVPRLFMLLPPTKRDLDPTLPFLPSNLLRNKGLRLVLLCEGLSGYGEDAHVTDHRGYFLDDPSGFVQDVGKLLLHLVAVAGTNNPGYETPALDRPLTKTGTPLDNCQRWYPSLRSYYEILQTAIQRQVGPAPSLNELRSLRGPTLKALEQWLVRLVRKQGQESVKSPRENDTLGNNSGMGLCGGSFDDLSDQFGGMKSADNFASGDERDDGEDEEMDFPEVTGPGGGQGYGGLFKMSV
ncbi:Serine/threonine-protein kinase dclk3, partial [Mortierella sp. AM989]